MHGRIISLSSLQRQSHLRCSQNDSENTLSLFSLVTAFQHVQSNNNNQAELTNLAIDSGGRLFLLINNLFSTILLNLAFVLRARNLYSCTQKVTSISITTQHIYSWAAWFIWFNNNTNDNRICVAPFNFSSVNFNPSNISEARHQLVYKGRL